MFATCTYSRFLFVCFLHDVKNVLKMFHLSSGEEIRAFPLDVGSIVGFTGRKKDSEIFYSFTSFLSPGPSRFRSFWNEELWSLKGQIDQKWKICYCLFTLKLFQISFFLLKEYILKKAGIQLTVATDLHSMENILYKSMGTVHCLVTNNIQNISYRNSNRFRPTWGWIN